MKSKMAVKRIKAIIFDFNGVIADDEPMHLEAFKKVCRLYNIPFKIGDYKRFCYGLADREGFKNLAGFYGIKSRDYGKLVRAKHKFYLGLLNRLRMVPGAVEEIKYQGERFRLALASCAVNSEINQVLRHLQVQNKFEVVIGASDFKHGKPDPEPYLLVAKRMHLKPEECIAIEDTPNGVSSAKSAGVFCIGLTTSLSVKALAQADAVAKNFAGVRRIINKTAHITK